ncbi:MAG: hypothetical protein J6I87_06505 [Rikenellaceae bacterium]|nr:hypothetical protein [Rikenellaceae bacterium]
MKRIIIILAMIFAAVAANAQQPNEEIVKEPALDATATTTPTTSAPLTDSTSIVLRADTNTATLDLEVGGFVISIGSPEKQARRSEFAIGAYHMDIGTVRLIDEGYAGYSADEQGFMARGRKSVHFATTLFRYSLRLSDSRVPTKCYFYTGLRISNDNFSLQPDRTLGNDATGRVVPITLDREYKKSKLFVERIGVPIGFYVSHRPSRLRFDVSVINSINFSQRTVYKKPKMRSNAIRGINPYQCAIRASINYSSYGFYTEYSFTPLFRKGVGSSGNIFSLGATINVGGVKF